MNYYNEFDPKAAAWLRELIRAGLIPAGNVDERSIEDVRPQDLRGYVQCHFFAGIGGWSYALGLAGWPSDRPVWTGSCPCQPFSAAGQGNGFEDERHLWPAWQHLIAQCRPPIIFGEQVASKAADAWIDLVQSDLEGLDYAFGCIPFPVAGIGAPHIRDRNYWMAYASGEGLQEQRWGRIESTRPAETGFLGGMVDPMRRRRKERHSRHAEDGLRVAEIRAPIGSGAGWLADMHGERCGETGQRFIQGERPERIECAGIDRGANPLHGFWSDADWLLCRDGKWRPVEPGTFPLAHGLPARVVRLRGYGNAIVPQQAALFIEAAAESVGIQLQRLEAAA